MEEQVGKRREETGYQEEWGNDQCSPPHQDQWQQATDATRGGQWTNTNTNQGSQTIPCGGRQAPYRGHKRQHISQTLRRPVENWEEADTGLEAVGIKVYLSKITGKLIEKKKPLSAVVMIDGNTYKATVNTGATASFVSEEIRDSLAA